MRRRTTSRTGPAGGRLPRSRPTPEPNIIQAPELIRAMTKRLGMKQMHVAPALNEGVQAVVLIDDISENRAAELQRSCTGWSVVPAAAGDGTDFCYSILFNPYESTRTIRVQKMLVSHTTDEPGQRNAPARLSLMRRKDISTGGFASGTTGNTMFTDLSYHRTPVGQVKGNVLLLAQWADMPIMNSMYLDSWVPVWFDVHDDEIIIMPGQGLLWMSEENSAFRNTSELMVSWWWTEEETK